MTAAQLLFSLLMAARLWFAQLTIYCWILNYFTWLNQQQKLILKCKISVCTSLELLSQLDFGFRNWLKHLWRNNLWQRGWERGSRSKNRYGHWLRCQSSCSHQPLAHLPPSVLPSLGHQVTDLSLIINPCIYVPVKKTKIDNYS